MALSVCTVSGVLYKPDGTTVDSTEVRFTRSEGWFAGTDGVASTETVAVNTNGSGEISVDLAEGLYLMEYTKENGKTSRTPLGVPDAATASIEDLIEITASSLAAFLDGTAGSPAFNFANDLDTGLFLKAANTIGISTGGAERGSISTTGMSLNLPLTGTAVTQSATDTTAGRLLKVGDFGAGAAAGTYLFGRANILGNVMQSGGVPTGAVIERGSNANGSFVRFADGTQICTHITTVANVSEANGGVFRSPSFSWTFPAAFAAGTKPAVRSSSNAADNEWGTGVAISHTVGAARLIRPVSGADPREMSLLACGRWF